jgi:cellulose synthase/poly-beta-1,6-N-acetylglucosamine synthase-like glycosyltransferase
MTFLSQAIGWFYEYFIFYYGMTLLVSYLMLVFFSVLAIRGYVKRSSYTDNDTIVFSPLAPGISVIAPAFNEELTIVANVHSLLTLNYVNFEVIIINDGSSDRTLEKLVAEFKLIPTEFSYKEKVGTRPVRGFYKSTDIAFAKLLVIDKENGKSKADGSNAGINAAVFPYFVCTDVDCILHKDTLAELIRPIIQEPSRKVLAVGAPLRMANSCDIDGGNMVRMRPPTSILPRFQEVEYIRAYILSKMGWSMLNAVPNVSGGLGLFDTEIALQAGGYNAASFAEDQDLVSRMIRFCCMQKIKYCIRYIPKTLCWTEGPVTVKSYVCQRTRWGQGLIQLISVHFKVFFNPKYKNLGLVVFPYNFFFEFLAPIIEVVGLIYLVSLCISGVINWPFALLILLFVYSYSVLISTIAILWDQLTFRSYTTWREALGLCLMPFLEMFIYHPLALYSSLRGYVFFLIRKKQVWGDMDRRGFECNQAKLNKAMLAHSIINK